MIPTQPTMFNHICLGGTFDHLHAGHKALLFAAFTKAKHVYIGLATDAFAHRKDKKLSALIEPFGVRKTALESYIANQGWSKQAQIIPLNNPFGHSIIENGDDALPKILEAIIVSENSKAGAEAVNNKRVSQGLKPLEIVSIPMIARGGYEVSSASIRAKLAIPMGELTEGNDEDPTVAAIQVAKKVKDYQVKNPNAEVVVVGDIAVANLLAAGLTAHIVVTDGRSRRAQSQNLVFPDRTELETVNPPGCVTLETIKVVRQAVAATDEIHIKVIGEEDLLVLPFVMELKIGDVIIYGQPQKGIVVLTIQEEDKKHVSQIMQEIMVKDH